MEPANNEFALHVDAARLYWREMQLMRFRMLDVWGMIDDFRGPIKR